MKNYLLISLLSLTSLFAQKKVKNGTVFSNHPGIALVNQFNEAFVNADTLTLASLLHEKARIKNGLTLNKDEKGANKQQIIGTALFWKANIRHFSITQDKPAYPDAIEYKKGGQLWVQSWDRVNGYHNETGVKLDAPLHRLFRLTPDAKQILWIGEYFERDLYRQIWTSTNDRKNGQIYINHPNINSVRKMMHAFEFGDYEEAYSYFDENVTIEDINQPIDEKFTLEQAKENDKNFLANFTINSFDEWGYPDYLEYDWGDSRVVQTWWKFRLTRKSDGEKIVLPVHFQDVFNQDGKITRRTAYYSQKLLD